MSSKKTNLALSDSPKKGGLLFNLQPFDFTPTELFDECGVPQEERFSLKIKPFNIFQRESLRKINSDLEKEVYEPCCIEHGFQSLDEFRNFHTEIYVRFENIQNGAIEIGYKKDDGTADLVRMIAEKAEGIYEDHKQYLIDSRKISRVFKEWTYKEKVYMYTQKLDEICNLIFGQIVGYNGYWMVPNEDNTAMKPIETAEDLKQLPPQLFTMIWGELSTASNLTEDERIAL
jgi:hypothetical protein